MSEPTLASQSTYGLTYFNSYGHDPLAAKSSWDSYLNNALLAKYLATTTGYFLEKTSREQINAIDRASQQISGTLAVGLSSVAGGLSSLSDRIRSLSKESERTNELLEVASHQISELHQQTKEATTLLARIDLRASLLIDQQRITNLLLQDIGTLLRIPESQKQRILHIERGLKLSRNAQRDPSLYSDALKEFLAAEALDPYDYFVLHRIGILFLYAPEQTDITKALEYLSRAGKYAAADQDSPSHQALEAAASNFQGNSETNLPAVATTNWLAGQGFLEASRAAYILGDFQNAVALSEKSISNTPGDSTAWFHKAKCLAALGRGRDAVEALNACGNLESRIALAARNDLDLLRSPEVLQWLLRHTELSETVGDYPLGLVEKRILAHHPTPTSSQWELVAGLKKWDATFYPKNYHTYPHWKNDPQFGSCQQGPENVLFVRGHYDRQGLVDGISGKLIRQIDGGHGLDHSKKIFSRSAPSYISLESDDDITLIRRRDIYTDKILSEHSTNESVGYVFSDANGNLVFYTELRRGGPKDFNDQILFRGLNWESCKFSWQKQFDGAYDSALLANGIFYISTVRGDFNNSTYTLHTIDARSGTDISAIPVNETRGMLSPAISKEDILFLKTSDGFLALDPMKASRLWEINTKTILSSADCRIAPGPEKTTYVFSPDGRKLLCFQEKSLVKKIDLDSEPRSVECGFDGTVFVLTEGAISAWKPNLESKWWECKGKFDRDMQFGAAGLIYASTPFGVAAIWSGLSPNNTPQ